MTQNSNNTKETTRRKSSGVIKLLCFGFGVIIAVVPIVVEKGFKTDWDFVLIIIGLILAFEGNLIDKRSEIKEKEKRIQELTTKIDEEVVTINDKNKRITSLENTIRENDNTIKSAYENQLLWEVMEKAIAASKASSEDNASSMKKIKHFLSEIRNSDRLNPLILKLGNEKYTNLYNTKGTLSITDAPLFAWKNPEYSWFLISNYTAVLLNRWKKSQHNSMSIVDRSSPDFFSFLKQGDCLLKRISEGKFKNEENIRFYLLDKTDVNNDKALIGQLIAGHDLFGIHLFVVDKSILKDNNIKHHYEGLINLSIIENNVIDVMVYTGSQKTLMVKYPSDGELKEDKLSSIPGYMNLKGFIIELAGLIISNPNYLIYPPKKEPSGEEKINNLPYFINKTKTHISFNKK